MKIYRIAKKKFIEDFSGEGARLYGGRWNKKGSSMVYFSESLSLCVLEILVHVDYQFFADQYAFVEVEVSGEYIDTLKSPSEITLDWRKNPPSSRTQDYGSSWLNSIESLGLRVPSAVLHNEFNILINPRHPAISDLKIMHRTTLEIDSRVFSKK